MNFLEKDLEQILFETPKDFIRSRGLKINGKLLRQQRLGNYGVADLISIEKPQYSMYSQEHQEGFSVTIYELKQEKIGASTLVQAIGYAKGVQRWFDSQDRFDNYYINVNVTIIGRAIDTTSNFIYLSDFIKDVDGNDFLKVITYEYKYDGIHFKNHRGYSLIEEGF